jgi:excisionase family DNA binding protein
MSNQLAYSINDACALIGIGRTALYEDIARGELRAIKRGRRTLILADDLLAWLDTLPSINQKTTGASRPGTIPMREGNGTQHRRINGAKKTNLGEAA